LGGLSEEMTVECARAVLGKEPLVLGPPLRGGGWLAANGPSNSSGHRRALIPFGGGVHIAQRFAIDWVQLRDEGRTYTGDAKDNKNYRCYGAEALAAIEGVVVAVKDGVPENVPGLKSRAVPMTRDTMAGNYVVLDVGEGRYAYYAHFQPGQIRVKLGDKVSRGQVLGLVGNSGNSTEPHLHFQISDTDSLFTSEGLPYHFRSFEVLGKGWDWKSKGTNGESDKRQEELPLELQVVRFPTSSD
jgi:murein DD-endopeptidase MepM/ murein hydrolase activator NlpD